MLAKPKSLLTLKRLFRNLGGHPALTIQSVLLMGTYLAEFIF